ncbi:MAG: hypothetical protein A2277_00425 [Desulfobacterales bacterium RIFOXYA12_FULL_46_15]|nr:MAG: hypothetical protein A2277_00425 [Desulfobacterales bacterium RIFOXYA12_FULL_46_15]
MEIHQEKPDKETNSRGRFEGRSGLRISLVFPPSNDKREIVSTFLSPPLGLLYIAACLERAGYIVTVHDFVFDLKAGRIQADADIYRKCADRILASDPDVVGFSTQCTTGPGSINIAHQLKRVKPSVITLLGGHDVSFLAPDYLKAFPWIDFVIAGEGEIATTELMRAIEGRTRCAAIPGLAYRVNRDEIRLNPGIDKVMNLDSMPAPAYHLVDDIGDYFRYSKHPTILIDSGRGCPYSCEFCQTSQLTGHEVRYRSVRSLISELRENKNRYGVYQAYFVHDLFTARRSFVEELCCRLMEEDLQIPWACRCRLDQIDGDLLSLMKRAGCATLLCGVESGSRKTLKAMKKGYDPKEPHWVVDQTRLTVENGIFPTLSMLVGVPDETLEDLCATMELAAEFTRIGGLRSFIQLLSPLPGTGLIRRFPDRMEYKGEEAATAFSQGIEFHNGKRLPEDENLIRKHPKLFPSFRTVIPEHGDVDLSIDVAYAYCRLIEIYGYSFISLAEHANETLVDLFCRYRKSLCEDLSVARLQCLDYFAVLDGFRRFAKRAFEESDVSEKTREVFRFESLLQEITVSDSTRPGDEPDGRLSHPGSPCRNMSGARLFRTKYDLPWLPERNSGEKKDVRYFLLLMVDDRLRVKEIEAASAKHLECL